LTLGLIKHIISSRSPKVISLLYKRLVHPKLEVGMFLASPYFKKDIKFLEDVQRRASKVTAGMQELSYPVRLSKLNLPTLVYRRNRGDAILTFKLLRANILPALFPTVGTNSRTRGHQLKLVKQSTTSRVCTQFFSTCIVNNWKKLSNEPVTAESIDVFK
jgi:hypothetical protein